jgi:hypothetical protein
MLLSALSKPLITAQNATGNVRDYQLIVGGINLLNLPGSFICLYLGCNPQSVVIVAIVVEVIAFMARVYMLPKTIPSFSPLKFLKDIGLNCLLVAAIASIPAFIIDYYLPKHFWTFVFNVLFSICISSVVILYFGCTYNERTMILSKAKSIRNKFHK